MALTHSSSEMKVGFESRLDFFFFVVLSNTTENKHKLHFKANISTIFLHICQLVARSQVTFTLYCRNSSSVTLAASLRQGNGLMQTQKCLRRNMHTQFQRMDRRKEGNWREENRHRDRSLIHQGKNKQVVPKENLFFKPQKQNKKGQKATPYVS